MFLYDKNKKLLQEIKKAQNKLFEIEIDMLLM